MHAALPGASGARRLLLTSWPDVGPHMVRVALGSQSSKETSGECYSVRAAALRFLACAMAEDPSAAHPAESAHTVRVLACGLHGGERMPAWR